MMLAVAGVLDRSLDVAADAHDACRGRGTGQNHGQLMLMMLAAWGSTSHEVAAVDL